MRDWISAGSGHCHPPTHWRVWPMSWRPVGTAQGVVARIDWARFLPLYQQAGRRAFLAELEREVPARCRRRRHAVREDPNWSSGSPMPRAAAQEASGPITSATRWQR